MSERFRLDRKIGFQNTFYTKCINVIIDSIGPSIILRSILFSVFNLVLLMEMKISIRLLYMPLFGASPTHAAPNKRTNILC